ncbi:hypothetical protein Q4S41_07410 [Hymenobacter sp. CA1UV-4]|nr:hypothetical protein [Hymenobacter sp. CA1UV-4]
MKSPLLFPLATALAAFSLAGCSKDNVATPQTEFTLHMDNGAMVNNAAGTPVFTSLVLNATPYKNANGDDFTVSTLKYYISNVKLNKADGSSYAVPDSYFLVDQADATTQDLTMTGAPEGDYSSVSFIVGVDSARTKAGNFGTGVLNSSKGMFWPMNGGSGEFINFKLEGYSPQAQHTAPATTGGLVFHVAGYQHSTTNTIRTVTVPFPSGTNLLIRADHQPEVHMLVNIAKLFDGPNPAGVANPPFMNPVKFSSLSATMSPTTPMTAASKLADNIVAGMFSVGHIHAN